MSFNKLHKNNIREEYNQWTKSVGIIPDEETWETWQYQQEKIDELKLQIFNLKKV